MRKKVRFIIEKICKCGCGEKFFQHSDKVGYIFGHASKITRKLMVGDKAPGWRGGIIYKRGYVFIYSPEHPHNDDKYVKRSRLAMEKKLGRFLETSEVIHHINGIKDDDRIENLFLTTRSEHSHIHGIANNRKRSNLGRFK